MEYFISGPLYAVGYHNFSLCKQHIRQEINEYSVKCTLSGALGSRNKINSVIEKICKNRRFDPRTLKQTIQLSN